MEFNSVKWNFKGLQKFLKSETIFCNKILACTSFFRSFDGRVHKLKDLQNTDRLVRLKNANLLRQNSQTPNTRHHLSKLNGFKNSFLKKLPSLLPFGSFFISHYFIGSKFNLPFTILLKTLRSAFV